MPAESFARCRSCGAINDSRAQLCDLCLSSSMQHSCDSCGAPLGNPFHTFCHSCGTSYPLPGERQLVDRTPAPGRTQPTP